MSCYKVSTMSCYKPVNYVPERFRSDLGSYARKRLRWSGVGMRHSLGVGESLWRWRATKSYAASRSLLGMRRAVVARRNGPPRYWAIRRAASDRIAMNSPESLSFGRNQTIESTELRSGRRARRWRPYSPWREANRRVRFLSRRSTVCTAALQKPHSSSKSKTGCKEAGIWLEVIALSAICCIGRGPLQAKEGTGMRTRIRAVYEGQLDGSSVRARSRSAGGRRRFPASILWRGAPRRSPMLRGRRARIESTGGGWARRD